jgi:acyl-homoserine lactone synthase
MIDLVLPENRFAFARALLEMHHDRKQVFVDRLGWGLPSGQSWLEVDDFDSEYAVYLLCREFGTGRHQASVRLLPSTQPHVLASVFPKLCAGSVPVAEDCWEISRLVATPAQTNGTALVKVHRLLALALVEFALLNRIRSYSLVIDADRVPALLSMGWEVRPLGLGALCQDREIQALQIVIVENTLATMRRKLGIDRSVLRHPAVELRAA